MLRLHWPKLLHNLRRGEPFRHHLPPPDTPAMTTTYDGNCLQMKYGLCLSGHTKLTGSPFSGLSKRWGPGRGCWGDRGGASQPSPSWSDSFYEGGERWQRVHRWVLHVLVSLHLFDRWVQPGLSQESPDQQSPTPGPRTSTCECASKKRSVSSV